MKLWFVVLGLGAVSMAIRGAGPLLFGQRKLPTWLHGPLLLLTPVMLGGLAIVNTFATGRHLVLDARAAGLGAAVVCAVAKAPLLVVMLAGALAAGLVRLLV